MTKINWIIGTSGSAELMVGDLNASHPDVINRPLKQVFTLSLIDTGSDFLGFAQMSHTQSADTITDGTFAGANYAFSNGFTIGQTTYLDGNITSLTTPLLLNGPTPIDNTAVSIQLQSGIDGNIWLLPYANKANFLSQQTIIGGNNLMPSFTIPSTPSTILFISGNVGINSPSASVTLDVSGSAIIRGILSSSQANITNLIGTASVATSASYATIAQNVLSGNLSASFATTSSAATSITFPIVSASHALNSDTANSATSSSFATNTSGLNGKGSGSFTGSFTGSLLGNALTATSASLATSASAATSITFPIVSSSYSITSSYASVAQNVLGNITSASYALTASFASNASTPVSVSFATTSSAATSITFPIVSASHALNSDTANSVTSASYALIASFAANAATPISVSFATTSSAATSITFPIVSSSHAITSSFAITAATSSIASTSTLATNAVFATTATSASYAGTSSLLLGSITSASYALTASFAANAGGGGPVNASQVNPGTYPSGAYIYTGSLTITGSVYSRLNIKVVTGSYTASESDQFISVNAGGATASVYLPTVSGRLGALLSVRKEDSSSFPIVIFPSGTETIDYNPNRILVNQADSATLVAGFGLWMSDGFNTSSIFPSASYAITASFALNAAGSSVSSSYALTASYASLAQNVLGSISNATSASYALTASYAKTSSFASNALTANTATTVIGPINSNLIISGNLSISGTISSNISMKIITGSYTASSTDNYLIGDATTGNVSILLPTTSLGIMEIVNIRKDATANTMTINPIGSDKLGYAASSSLTVTRLTPLDLTSDVSGTWIVSSYA